MKIKSTQLLLSIFTLLGLQVQSQTWSKLITGTQTHLLGVSAPSEAICYVSGNSGLILKTKDGGANWVSQSTGTSQNLYSIYFTSVDTGYAVGDNGSAIKTTNGGATWTAMTVTNEALRQVRFVNDSVGYISGGISGTSGHVFKTTDRGLTWASTVSSSSGQFYSTFYTSSKIGFAGEYSGKIYKTINGDTTWTPVNTGLTNIPGTLFFTDASTGFYPVSTGAVLKTIDGGGSWSAMPSLTTNFLASIDFCDANNGFIVGGNVAADTATVLKTTNGGTTWTKATLVPNLSRLTRVDFYDANIGYAVGLDGTIVKFQSINPPAVPGCSAMASLSGGGVICSGNTSTINISFTGAWPWRFTFAINGISQPEVTGITQSSYTLNTSTNGNYNLVSVTDANCTGAVNGSATVSTAIASATISGGGTICPGTASTININLNGTAPWDFIYAVDGVSQPPVTGTTSSVYTFTTSVTGTYTLVSVTDANCSGSVTGNVTVSQTTPTATISGGGTICAGSTTNLNFAFTGASPWSFEYSDGTTSSGIMNSTLSNKTITVSSAGSYSLTSVSTSGCSGTVAGSAIVAVNTLPTIGITVSPSATICAGTSVTLTGTGGINYSWSGGITDGQAFTPGSTQTYMITGTGANACSNTVAQSITVNPLPTISSIATPASAAVCSGGSCTLQGQSSGFTTFTWSGGVTDGVAFTPITTTTYTVTGTDANNCSGKSTRVVSVLALPSVSIITSPSTTVCEGSSVTVKGIGASTYLWSGGITDGVSFKPKATTTYTLTGTAGNCIDTAIQTITVTPCSSKPVNITVSSTDVSSNGTCDGTGYATVTGGVPPYNITFAGSSVKDSVLKINNLCAGFYTVKTTDANLDTASFTFVVGSPATTFKDPNPPYVDSTIVDTLITNAIPNCVIDYNLITSIFISNFFFATPNSINVTWSIMQGNVTSIQDAQYNFFFPGVYTFILDLFCTNRAPASVKGVDQLFINDSNTGIETIETTNLSVRPNPFTDQLNVVVDKASSVKITDVLGNQIYSGKVNSGATVIETSNFSSGVYLLTISNSVGIVTKKIIKN